MIYDYQCKKCKKQFVITDAPMGHKAPCPDCQSETDRIFLVAPALKMKRATAIEKGITRDITEMSILEEMRDASQDRSTKYEINKEIDKINNTPVTGGK